MRGRLLWGCPGFPEPTVLNDAYGGSRSRVFEVGKDQLMPIKTMLRPKRATRTSAPYLTLVPFIYFALCTIPAASHAQQSTETDPFSVIERTWKPQEILARFTEVGAPAWAQGEVLTFFHREEAQAVHVDGSFEIPLQRIANTDIWTVSVRIPDLSRAVIRYRFKTDNPRELVPARLGEHSYQYWRGPEAPESPKRMTTLSGRVYEHTIESDTLKESRRISAYLPPDHNADQRRYPVIYMADGQNVLEYATILEALILEKKIPATVLIGIHSGAYKGDKEKAFDPSKDLRSIEYLEGFDQFVPGVDASRFGAHEHFFLHEVGEWAEEHLGVSTDRAQRLLFGTSNGGAFAVSVGIRHGEHFGKILVFSVAWKPALAAPEWNSTTYPHYYLAAGSLEEGFFEATSRWAEILKSQGFEHVFRARVSGHDPIFWQEEFARAVVWALG